MFLFSFVYLLDNCDLISVLILVIMIFYTVWVCAVIQILRFQDETENDQLLKFCQNNNNNNNNGVMNKYCVLQTVLFPAINEIQAQLFLPPSSSSYEMQQALTCS